MPRRNGAGSIRVPLERLLHEFGQRLFQAADLEPENRQWRRAARVSVPACRPIDQPLVQAFHQ